jgi:hypothetical protein
MLQKFEELPESSRVWVYQSDRSLEEKELGYIKNKTAEFISTWESHGSPVPASFKIIQGRFLVIAADESSFGVSGCSTDKSVHFIKSLESSLAVGFFDRFLIPFKTDSGISFHKMDKLKTLIREGEIKPQDILYNTLVSTISELKNSFEIKVIDSFLAKYLALK